MKRTNTIPSRLCTGEVRRLLDAYKALHCWACTSS